MGRRQSRETALQAIFQVDVGRSDPEFALNYLIQDGMLKKEDVAFAKELLTGTLKHLDEIDAMIASQSKDWQLDRLARVDRNIMRLAIYEILYLDDIPPGVSVNEAVDIAKLFGGQESGKFVNGILGALLVVMEDKVRKTKEEIVTEEV